ncbi:MAG: phage holin family protein [Deltaproteobacteria bacterium]|jgi:putative membrane protein|nr:phage holin family protein [Deltaproteobacteria bacterium]
MSLVLSFLLLSVAILGVSAIVPGIRLRGFKSALAVAAVYGLLNFVLFKVLIFITFPLVILKVLTLGLFGIVLNAVLLMITDKLLDGFEIDGFGSALLGAVGISVANLLLGFLF